MRLIGLTGGIASGKSTVARRLAEHGAHVIDADQLARDVVEPGMPALAAIAVAFGAQVLTTSGELDRARLGQLAFADEASRLRLENIIHPAIHEEFTRRVEAITLTNPDATIVYDVPLLVETKRDFPWDFVITTRAGREVQLARMLNERGYDLATAEARLAAQATDEQRAERADAVIDTSGPLAATMSTVDALWVDLLSK
ncbi:MAG: dephospho-CoA kinase [Microbacteriaceae bacterium]